jgi:hypothetical protein
MAERKLFRDLGCICKFNENEFFTFANYLVNYFARLPFFLIKDDNKGFYNFFTQKPAKKIAKKGKNRNSDKRQKYISPGFLV